MSGKEITVASITAVVHAVVSGVSCADPEESVEERFRFAFRIMDDQVLNVVADHVKLLHELCLGERVSREQFPPGSIRGTQDGKRIGNF